MNYFVTIKGIETTSNLTKKQAINAAIKLHESDNSIGGIQIGIGKYKYKKGIKIYTLQPYFFYL